MTVGYPTLHAPDCRPKAEGRSVGAVGDTAAPSHGLDVNCCRARASKAMAAKASSHNAEVTCTDEQADQYLLIAGEEVEDRGVVRDGGRLTAISGTAGLVRAGLAERRRDSSSPQTSPRGRRETALQPRAAEPRTAPTLFRPARRPRPRGHCCGATFPATYLTTARVSLVSDSSSRSSATQGSRATRTRSRGSPRQGNDRGTGMAPATR